MAQKMTMPKIDAQPILTEAPLTQKSKIDELKSLNDDPTSALPTDAVVLWGGPGDPNGEFDGGLNDWTTEGTDATTMMLDAPWTFEADADIAEGAFAPAAPIASPSAANGAMGYNSDFYDNGGDDTMLGMGPVPGPHIAHLISPTIDMTDNSSIALNFFSYFRKFTSTVSVSYSNDNGTTWSEAIEVHDENENPTNGASTNREVLIYLPGAGGTSEFKFRFTFEGNYYFWMVDDVAIIEAPRHDLKISSFFYTPASFEQPQAHINIDTFAFFMYVTNAGTEPQTNIILGAQVRDEDNDIIYETSTNIGDLEPGITDSVFDIAGTFVPDMLEIGTYRLTYTITADSTDQWTADNLDGDDFRVSEEIFRKDHTTASFDSYSNLGGPWQIGAVFETSGGFGNSYFTAESITFAGTTNQNDPIMGKTVSVYLLKIKEEINDGFGNLVDESFITNPGFELLGVGEFTYTNNNQRRMKVTTPLSDFDGEPSVILEENTRYLVLLDYSASSTIFQGFNNKINFRDRLNFLAFNEGSGTWFGGFTDGEFMQPIIRLELGFTTVGTNDQLLPESVLHIQPNPTSDQLGVQLDLEAATKAMIVITDITGKVMEVLEFDAAHKENITVDVQDYANGTYLLRLSTEAGARTLKFVVQH